MGPEATPELASRLDLAVAAAREAGQLTLGFFQREDLAVERKADNSPVTAADRQAEQLLRARIREVFPDDGILGEEFGEEAGTSGFRWILDPIDGTKSFICGVPLYGTLIGVERAGASVVGVIYIPGLDECVYAAIGGGAWYTHGQAAPRPARVSQRDQLADAVFLTSQLDTFYPRAATGLLGPGASSLHHANLGRLLRIPAGRDGTCRRDGRPGHERLGRRCLAADPGGSGGRLYRLVGEAHHSCRRGHRLQSGAAGPGAGDHPSPPRRSCLNKASVSCRCCSDMGGKSAPARSGSVPPRCRIFWGRYNSQVAYRTMAFF